MESLLLNDICVNLIGIYCFWSYVQLRNEIMLISSIHYETKLNGQTQYCLGENEFRGSHLKWSLLIFLWTFKEDHVTNFATANTAANCQVVGRWQFSAISSLDVRGVSRMHKQNFVTQPRDWPTTSIKISTPREDHQLLRMVRTNHFISAPGLLMQMMIRRFGRRMSVRTIRRQLLAAEYWSWRPAICPRLTLEHRQRRREWGIRYRVWDLRQWRRCNFSDESWFPYTTVTVGSGCALGKGIGWLMPASSLIIEIVARQSWYGVQSTMGEEWASRDGWRHEPALVHPDPEESNAAMGDGGVWT